MIEPVRHDWPKIIEQIELRGITKYKLSVLMRRQLVQIQRWCNGARVEHYDGEMLLSILDDVSRETLQPVTVQFTNTVKQ